MADYVHSVSIPACWGTLEPQAKAAIGFGRDDALQTLAQVATAVHELVPERIAKQGELAFDGDIWFALGWLTGHLERADQRRRVLSIGHHWPPSAAEMRSYLDVLRSHFDGYWRELGWEMEDWMRVYEPTPRPRLSFLEPRLRQLLAELGQRERHIAFAVKAAALLLKVALKHTDDAVPYDHYRGLLDGLVHGLGTRLGEEDAEPPLPSRSAQLNRADFFAPRLYGEFVFSNDRVLVLGEMWAEPWGEGRLELSGVPRAQQPFGRGVSVPARRAWSANDPDVLAAASHLLVAAEGLPLEDQRVLQVRASAVIARMVANQLDGCSAELWESRSHAASFRWIREVRFTHEDFPLFVAPAGFGAILSEVRRYFQDRHQLSMPGASYFLDEKANSLRGL